MLQTQRQRTATPPSPVSANKPVALTPISLENIHRTIIDIFFTDWLGRNEWIVTLDTGNEWPFVCDRQRKVITIGRRVFENRDLLRSAVISLLALARHPGQPSVSWSNELREIAAKAAFIRRYALASHLSETARLIDSNNVRIQYDADADIVYITDWITQIDTRTLSAADFDPMFDNSLTPQSFERILERETNSNAAIEDRFGRRRISVDN